MGSKLCNCSFLTGEQDKEENISQIQNQELTILSANKLKGKKCIFYLDSTKIELSPNSNFDNNSSMKIKQIYIINRLKILSKKIREFLIKKRTFMTFATISTNNNEINNNNRLNTISSMNNPNYLNTDTGEIAYNNLALIKNQNIIKQKNYIKKYNEEEYSENDGVVYLELNDDIKILGIYYNNAFNGFSKIIFSNKEIFKGEIFDNIANGYGIYEFIRQGSKYEGYWENNYKNDIGYESWWFGDYYKGNFKNGKKNGIGSYYWKDGSFYKGEWLNNYIHGWGVFNSKNKRIYKGRFIMNKMNGYGEMTYFKNNGFYYGYWKDNKKKGFGVEYSPRKGGENKIYVGFWENNERYGYGILFHKNDEEYNIMALWKNNKIIRTFRAKEEFFQSIEQAGFDKYLFFFEKNFEDNIRIINNIKEDDEKEEDE